MRRGNLLAGMMAILSCVDVANGQTWNLATDWNIEQNPNDAWSFGYQPALTDPLTLYDFPDQQEGGRWQLHRSFSITTAEPYIGQVVEGGYLWYIREGTVVAHPGPGTDNGVPGGTKGEYTTVRWTAPEDGLYDVNVLFEGLAGPVMAPCCPHTTSDVHVQINGENRFSGLIEGYVGGHPEDLPATGELPTQGWRQILDLSAGDTVDFAVGDGQNASYYADLTGITATINTFEGPLAGDFDGNDTIDAADYVVWRRSAGTFEQYSQWRSNFGLTVPSEIGAATAAAVPEPTALLVAVLAMALLGLGVRCR